MTRDTWNISGLWNQKSTYQNQKKKLLGWFLFILDSRICVYVCLYLVAKEAHLVAFTYFQSEKNNF